MKKLEMKTKIATITLILMLTISAILVALPAATAQEIPEKKTYAYIGAVPNPVGKGQMVLLHVGITDYLLFATDSWEDLSITIEKPDGTTDTITDISTDSTGGTGAVYTPDQVGTYYLQTHFPEQVYNWTSSPAFAPGLIGPVKYLASVSAELALVVQEEPIEYYAAEPLPAEYWTRPIDAQLREWNVMAGSWFEEPPNLFAPYNDGPETAHILWAKDLIRGGLSGGEVGEHAHDCGDAYRGKWQSPIIVEGVLVYRRFPDGFLGPAPPQAGVVAVDLHTGEELWFRNNTELAFGQTMYWSTRNMHGTFSYLWETVGSTWNAYDPLTGERMYTLTNVPSGSRVRSPNGEILIYTVDQANGRMTMWNSSNIPALRGSEDPTAGFFGFIYWTWLPEGKTVDAQGPCPVSPLNPDGLAGYQWNVTIPAGLPGGVVWTLEDRIIGSNIGIGELGVVAPTEILFWGISTASGQEGTLLFNETWTPPTDVVIGHVAASLEDDVFVLWAKETATHYGFSLTTGKELWGPTEPQYYLDSVEDTPQNGRHIAYGKFYSASVSGVAYCYDAKTGALLWTYEANDPYQEILWANNWWLRPLFITDEKIYLGHAEHSAIDPKPRGAPFICLDTTTGDEIFRIDGAFRSTRWGGRAIIGDSIIATQDTYDQRVYAVGKGPSATTVKAPETSVSLGTDVLVTGTVMDVSPGTEDVALRLRFPNGVPAVSDESMSDWMLYVYKQFARPADATGVPVKIEAIDPNGNYKDLGTATTDASGNYGFKFKPTIQGQYMIMATFYGSEGYYGSTTTTYLTVGPAPEPYPTIPPYPGYQGPSAQEVAQNVLDRLPAEPTADDIAQEVLDQLPEYPEVPEAPEYTTIDIVIIVLVAVAIIIGLVSLLRKRK